MASQTWAARLARTHLSRSAQSLLGESYALRPVGALTSKPYAFKTRSWELKSTESIDVFDGVGSNIRIDTRGSEIMRVLPRLNEHVNEEWISDKSRFSYDGLKRQRLSTPMVRTTDGALLPVSWDRARSVLRNALINIAQDAPPGFETHAVIGPYVDVAAALELRNQFYRWFPSGQISVQEQARGIPTDFQHAYRCNATLPMLEEADAVLLVGTDPRKEAPLLNSRLRKGVLHRGMDVASVGCAADLTFPVQHLGNTLKSLRAIADGKHPFAARLAAAERPVVLVSNRTLQRADGPAIFKLVEDIVAASSKGSDAEWDPLCVLQSGANTVGNLDLGFDDKYAGLRALDAGSWSKTKFLFLLGADDIDNVDVPSDCFVIYQGHHGDRGASIANIVLPGAAYTEKSATYVNTEGRVQNSKLAFFPPGLAMDDASVLRNILGHEEELEAMVERGGPTLELLAPNLAKENSVPTTDRVLGLASVLPEGDAKVLDTPLQAPVDNFYMTDPITRSSKTMAKCTRVRTTNNFL